MIMSINFIENNVLDVMDKIIDTVLYQNKVFCNNHLSGSGASLKMGENYFQKVRETKYTNSKRQSVNKNGLIIYR